MKKVIKKRRRKQLTVFGKLVVTAILIVPLIVVAAFAATSKNNDVYDYTPRMSLYNNISNEGRDILAKLLVSEPSLTEQEQIALVNVIFNNAEYMECSVEHVILNTTHPFKSTKDLSILKGKPKSRHYSIIQECLNGVNNVGSALFFDYYTTEQTNSIEFPNIQVY